MKPFLLFIYLIVQNFIIISNTNNVKPPPWMKNGCYKMGNTRRIRIPDCVEFNITTNACIGYCESQSFASSILNRKNTNNNIKPITSIGRCCNIMDTEDVRVELACFNKIKHIAFKSAKSCECYHCKRN